MYELMSIMAKNRFAIYLSSIPSLVDELSVRKKLKVIKQSHKSFLIYFMNRLLKGIYILAVLFKNQKKLR